MALALGSVVNAKPESAGWFLISSRYVSSGPANLLALNESVQCICSLDRMSWYNVAYLCGNECTSYVRGCVVAVSEDALEDVDVPVDVLS